jgi:MFS family permease
MTHLYNYATDHGVSKTVAASFISVIGAASLLGRLSSGAVSDYSSPKTAMFLCLLVVGGSQIPAIFASSPWGFFVFAMVFGLGYSGEIPLISAQPTL